MSLWRKPRLLIFPGSEYDTLRNEVTGIGIKIKQMSRSVEDIVDIAHQASIMAQASAMPLIVIRRPTALAADASIASMQGGRLKNKSVKGEDKWIGVFKGGLLR